MKKRDYIITAVSLLIILPLVFFSSLAQVKKNSCETDMRNLNTTKIINLQGWTLPKIQDTDFSESAIRNIQDLPITLKLYKPDESPIVELEFYNIRADQSIIVVKQSVRARVVIAYSFNEKVFCYEASYVPTIISNGEIVQVGVTYTVYYFDEDGDNLFETMYQTSENLEIIPDWIRNLK